MCFVFKPPRIHMWGSTNLVKACACVHWGWGEESKARFESNISSLLHHCFRENKQMGRVLTRVKMWMNKWVTQLKPYSERVED